MDFGELRRQQQESARLMTYQNSGYTNERVSKKTLLLYLDDDSAGGTNVLSGPNDFSVKLTEPIRIDALSEVYLDLFVTSSCVQSTADLMAFILKINEFNNNANSNNSSFFNKLVIPNENTAALAAQSVIHKGKKLNYVCTINPCTLTHLTGRVDSLGGNAMFNGDGRLIAEFVIISKN